MRREIGSNVAPDLPPRPQSPFSFDTLSEHVDELPAPALDQPVPDVEALVANIMSEPPFAGKATLERFEVPIETSLDYAVAVPVRDEEVLLPRALAALETAMRRGPAIGGLVIVVNDTEDASFDLARDFAMSRRLPCALLQVTFASPCRNAPHARRLAMDIAAGLAPKGHVLTTDADSHVGPDWVRICLRSLGLSFDLVCEDVRLDERELATLPPIVREVGDAERAYFEACEQLWQLWTGGNAGSFAYRASGASLALPVAAYRRLGGLPLPVCGEDAALCSAVVARGGRVMQARDIGTRTSARLEGRAPGGCGAALASRAVCDNPPCDSALIPLDLLHEQALAAIEGDGSRPTTRREPMSFLEVCRELARALRLIAEGG